MRYKVTVESFNNNELRPEVLVGHKFPFDEIKKAIKMIEEGSEKVCKVVLIF